MSELIGKTLARYQLVEEIGHGGMSTVYRARDLETEEEVAVKVLTPYVAQEPKFKERFDREIKLLKGLSHDKIVPILNYGDEGGVTYIVMPFYAGRTLQDLIDRRGIGLDEIVPILNDTTSALEYAHAEGIVHRDIKPSNILLDEGGGALLSDFGFAHVSETSHSLTGSVLIGTPAFMSPEQCRGEEVNPRSDQYSLGAVLYKLTTGQLPYEGDTPMSVVIQHINDPLPRPRYLNPQLPDVLEEVILRAMAKDPADRFSSVGALAVAFEVGIEESLDPETGSPLPGTVGPAPETQVISRRPKGLAALWTRNRIAAGLALLALLAVPLTAFALNGGLNGADSVPPATPTANKSLLATIDALSTENAAALADSEEPGIVETAVAGTVEALGLFDTPDPTATLGGRMNLTQTATPTPTATRGTIVSNDTGSGDEPPPPASPGPTATSVESTNTPGPGPINTPVPPVPPTTDPDKCKGPYHPQFPCTETPTP